MYGIAVHEAAGYVIARRGLGFDHEKIPKILLDKLVKEKPEFKQMANWKQWSAVKKSVLAKIKKITKRRSKRLGEVQLFLFAYYFFV
ncbi:hypothetical protein [Desulfofarcimen acetoxidans]|uniref:hypothetical protein n=1 Tax=Desulfofarcimen acetoxidans TaxID=58138 RepID=UPI00019E5F4C|nr:hypothetical protein [Desulfofarcimen acetoxidans]